MEKENNYNLPFSEYLENSYNHGKFVGVITKSQYALQTGYVIHEDMSYDLITKTRPDLEVDEWGNAINNDEAYINSNIMFWGYPGYFLLELPKVEMLSPKQFECLKGVLSDLVKYNNKIDEQGYGEKYKIDVYGTGNIKIEYKDYAKNVNELITELENYVQEPTKIKEEVIIGRNLDDIKVDTISFESTKAILKKESEKVSTVTNWNAVDWDHDFPTFNNNNDDNVDVQAVLDSTPQPEVEFDEEEKGTVK